MHIQNAHYVKDLCMLKILLKKKESVKLWASDEGAGVDGAAPRMNRKPLGRGQG